MKNSVTSCLALLAISCGTFVSIASNAYPEIRPEDELKALESSLTDEQIDGMMADASGLELGYAQYAEPSARPSSSQCRVKVTSIDPQSGTDPRFVSHLSRSVRRLCLGFMNFQLDARVASKPALARDNFVCAVTAIDEGTPDTYTSHKEGFEGVIVTKKLFRSPKVTPIDNTRTVEERHAGRPASLQMECMINMTGFANGTTLTNERDAWRKARITTLKSIVAERKAKAETEARNKTAARDGVDQELSRLTKTFLRLETQITSYNRCLEGYESFARKIRRVKIENESNTKECPILVATLKQKTSDLSAAAKTATTVEQQQSNVAQLKQLGTNEESICASQITYCEAHRPKN